MRGERMGGEGGARECGRCHVRRWLRRFGELGLAFRTICPPSLKQKLSCRSVADINCRSHFSLQAVVFPARILPSPSQHISPWYSRLAFRLFSPWYSRTKPCRKETSRADQRCSGAGAKPQPKHTKTTASWARHVVSAWRILTVTARGAGPAIA